MNMHAAKIANLDRSRLEAVSPAGASRPTRVVVDALSGLVADTLDVAQFARHARWNVTGPGAGTLTAIFLELGRTLDLRAERIANRIAALGGTVHATVDAIADNTQMEPLERQPRNEAEWLQATSSRLRVLAASFHDANCDCVRVGDSISSYHLTEGAAAVDEQLCIIDRHLPRT